MTDAELINAWVSSPDVIKSHTDFTKTPPVPASPADLQSQARTVLQLVLSDLMTHNSVRRMLARKKVTITLTTGTEQLPSDFGQEVVVTASASTAPLRKFNDELDYVRWVADNGIDTTLATTKQVTAGYYVFNRNVSGWQIVIVPGIGTSTTIEVWYVARMMPPFQLMYFQDDVHSIVYARGLRMMTGADLGDDFEKAIGRLAQLSTPMIGGYSKARHDPDMETRNQSRNAHYSGSV